MAASNGGGSDGLGGGGGGKIRAVIRDVMGAEHLTDAKFRTCFNAMRLSQEMTDVVIVVEGTEFKAHKLILSGCSPYFRGMFRAGNFGESHSERIEIDPKGELGIKADAVEELINYVYSGHLEITHQNVIDLIRAADLLELTEVKNQTLKVIEEHITFDTYLDIREVGNVFSCPRLLDAVDRFIRKNYTEFCTTQAFFELEEDELITYLKHNQLRTTSEEVVLSSVLEWCRRKNKLDRFPSLCPYVRFGLISVKFVLRYVREDADVRGDAAATDALLDVVRALPLPLPGLSRPRFSTQVLVAMPYRSKSFYLITFFGDHIEFVVKQFPEMIHEHIDALINYSACKVGENLLYMAGGTGYNENNDPFHSDKGFVYDLVEDSWTQSISLQGDSSSFGMASVSGSIYAMGGDSFNSSDEVLKADFMPNISSQQHQAEWSPVSRTIYTRSSVHMVPVAGRIFAIGGMLDGGYTSTVEAYDPSSDTWTEVDSMSQARCNPGVTVANGKIYVVGGLGDNLLGPPGALKTVEYYDPDSDAWTSLPDMYFARHSPAVALVNHKLFVFGGGSPSPLLRPGPERTIECFDFERHEWFVLQDKIPGRSNAMYVGEFFDNLDT